MEIYPHVKGDDIIPYAIEENVWIGIRDLFMKSPASRKLVMDGKARLSALFTMWVAVKYPGCPSPSHQYSL